MVALCWVMRISPKHNELFRRSQQEVGYRIVNQAASNARQIALP